MYFRNKGFASLVNEKSFKYFRLVFLIHEEESCVYFVINQAVLQFKTCFKVILSFKDIINL